MQLSCAHIHGNPLVFLWGNRDYLVGNIALMCRRGGERVSERDRQRERERNEREREREKESEKCFNGSGFLPLNFDDVHNAF